MTSPTTANLIDIVTTVLADAEAYLAGQPVTVPIPAQSYTDSGLKLQVSIPAISITFTRVSVPAA